MAIAKLLIKFGADIREVTGAVAKVESEIGKISKSFGSLGRTFLGGASAAALLDIGKNAVIASAKFESSFLKIKNLTDSTAADLGLFKKSLSGISNDVGAPIQDLVDGLYTITSAGLSGQAALDTLRISAQAAAIGMGDVNDIAKTISATLNAYGVANISASKAANILFNTAKLGAVDIVDLAPAMGKVIPIASSMGVSLDQVGGAIAAMSLQGIDASEAVTSLVSIMNAMIKPSGEASAIMKKYGTSMEQVRDVAKTDFAGALNLLTTSLGNNAGAISTAIGRVEGLKGVLALTGNNFERYSNIVDQTSKDVTSFGKANAEVQDTNAQKWAKVKAAVSNATLEIANNNKAVNIGLSLLEKLLDGNYEINKIIRQRNIAIEEGTKQIKDQVAELQKLGRQQPASTIGGPKAKSNAFTNEDFKALRDSLKISDKAFEKLYPGLIAKYKQLPDLPKLPPITEEIGGFISAFDQFKRGFESNVYKPLNQLDRLKGFDGIAIQVTALTRKFQQLKIEREKALSETAFRVTPLESKGDQPRSLAGKVIGAKDNPITQPIEDANKSTKDLLESLGQVGTVLTGIGEASAQAFGAMAAELLTGGVAFKDLGKFALEAARSIVKAALSEALATAIVSALKSSKGNLLLGIGLAVSGVALVSSLFKSKVPKLARGGLAFGPQLAIVGDNPNARTDPEVISPLSKLKGIMAAEVLRLGAILSQAFNASLKNVNFGAGTPSQIKVNIPSISSLLNGIGPIINPSSAFDFAPAPINVNVTGQVFGNDIRLLNDRLGATNNRIKGNKYQ